MLSLAVNVLGVCVAIATLGASYRLIDQRPIKPKSWRGFIFWIAINAALTPALAPALAAQYWLGVGAFVLFHAIAHFAMRAWVQHCFKAKPTPHSLLDK
ncbi:MAG: hypothetical protein ACI9W2_003002 [Gammaproteobacteria bacterium]|jgi:hypothetical protein